MEEYEFDPADEENWLRYFEAYGYCVLRSVLSDCETEMVKSKLWRDIELIFDVNKNEIASWNNIPCQGPFIIFLFDS